MSVDFLHRSPRKATTLFYYFKIYYIFLKTKLPRRVEPGINNLGEGLFSQFLALSSASVTLSQPYLPSGHVWVSPWVRRLTATPGRIVFALLRIACSPQVAPHPSSQRRSYFRLPGTGISRRRTFASQIAPAPRRTDPHKMRISSFLPL